MPDDDRLDSSEHDSDHELYDEAPRSIFAATWFRAVLVLIVLGVIGAIAVPYILDAMNPAKSGVASRPTDAPAPPATTPVPAPSAMSQPSGALPTQPDNAPPDTPMPERAAVEKRTQPSSTARKPLAGDASASADKSASGRRPTRTEKRAASPKPARSDKPTIDTVTAIDKTDTAMVPPTPDTNADAKAPAGIAKPAAARSTAAGEWWVQVGAFRDENAAKKVAGQLRDQNYSVEESVRGGGEGTTKSAAETPASAGAASSATAVDQYDVFVSGTSPAELTTRLAAKGLSAESSGSGAVVKPSLSLRDAVALSKDLAVDGLKVQVRRAGGAASTGAPAAADKRPARKENASDTLYRVRIGAFSDRATALTTLKELEAKGYRPFIARGGS